LGSVIAEKAHTIAVTASNAVRGVGAFMSELVATGSLKAAAAKWVETVAVEANTAAWYSNPILAIIAVALLAVVAVISAVSSAMKKNTEAIKENAKAEQEKMQKVQEEIDKNDELISKYRELEKEYEKTRVASDELEDAALAVAQAYNIQNAELLIAQGNYSRLTEEINEAR